MKLQQREKRMLTSRWRRSENHVIHTEKHLKLIGFYRRAQKLGHMPVCPWEVDRHPSGSRFHLWQSWHVSFAAKNNVPPNCEGVLLRNKVDRSLFSHVSLLTVQDDTHQKEVKTRPAAVSIPRRVSVRQFHSVLVYFVCEFSDLYVY